LQLRDLHAAIVVRHHASQTAVGHECTHHRSPNVSVLVEAAEGPFD
jgi:hypothetical protein